MSIDGWPGGRVGAGFESAFITGNRQIAVLTASAPGARRGASGARPVRPSRLVSGTTTSTGGSGFPVPGARFGGLKSVPFGLEEAKQLLFLFRLNWLLIRWG
jgi:hypothetical protein